MTLDLRYRIHQGWHWGTVGVWIPIMSLFLLDGGLNLFELGLFGAAFGLSNVLLEVPTGGLADQYGRVRIYRWALLFNVLAYSLFLFVELTLPAMLAGAMLAGASRALSSGTVDSWYVEQLKLVGRENDTHKALGAAAMWNTIGVAVGALLGGMLPQWIGIHLSPDNIYFVNVGFVALSYLLLCLVTKLVLHEPELIDNAEQHTPMSRIVNAVQYIGTDHNLRLILLGRLLFGFALASCENYWQPGVQLLQENAEQTMILGFITAAFAFAGAIGNGLSSKYTIWLKQHYGLALWLAFAASSIFLFLMAKAPNLPLFCCALIGMYACTGLIGPMLKTLTHSLVTNNYRASAMSLNSLTHQFGGTLSGIGIGWVIQQTTIATGWQLVAIIVVVATLSMFAIELPQSRLQSSTT
ncbi:MFS transporter [Photobacterium sagamiensis]|uniref:MFS transporter n=1 Tax=Photobacterium sagamiensis TaxID=2910241 RepID=UPI003D10F017